MSRLLLFSALNCLFSALCYLKTAFLLANHNREIFLCILLHNITKYIHFFFFFPYRQCLPRGLFRATHTLGAIHSTKIPTAPTGKSGPPQKVDQFFRNFSGWTEPIHWVSEPNFRKFWLNGSLALPPCFICLSRWVGGWRVGATISDVVDLSKEPQRTPLFCFFFGLFVCLLVFFSLPKQDANSGFSFLIPNIRCTGPKRLVGLLKKRDSLQYPFDQWFVLRQKSCTIF